MQVRQDPKRISKEVRRINASEIDIESRRGVRNEGVRYADWRLAQIKRESKEK